MNVPTYTGPNADLVNEVITFAFSDRILSGAGSGGESPIVVLDIRHAMYAAAECEIAVAYGSDGVLTKFGDQEFEWSVGESWFGLKESLVADLIHTKQWYVWEQKNKDALAVCESLALSRETESTELIDYLKTIVPEMGPESDAGYYRLFVVRQTADDLMQCCKNRAFHGKTDNFWEELFDIYRAGLWPCGWLGAFPKDGRFIAWRR